MKRMLSLLAVLGLAAAAHAQTLKVGDKAPPLAGGEWVKGEPVKEFENGKVYILECWATWCGPCIQAIPHVTELQKKYADKGLIVIGQNVWERDEAKVKPFVDEMGDKMGYRVVKDSVPGNAGGMATTWMKAAGKNGIPCSFIVDREGKIAWIGHPMQMDKPLAAIIDGKYDPKAEATKEQDIEALQGQFAAAMQKGDADETMKVFDKVVTAMDMPAGTAEMSRFQILMAMGKHEDAYKHAEKAIDATDDASVLNEIAWGIVDPDSEIPSKNFDVALKAAMKGVECSKGKDAAVLDTLARAHFAKGDKAKAISCQEKAIAVCNDDEMKADLQKTLSEYKS